MSRTETIVTPENIAVTYVLAGFASRFIAAIADLLIQAVILIAFGLTIEKLRAPGRALGMESIIAGAGYIGIFAILFAYPVICEMLWGGRTPGKRLFGLRVIRSGGYPINLASSVLRNVLRFVDFGIIPVGGAGIVLFGLPALITIFVSPSYRRLGDYAAGTIVIVEAGGTVFGSRTRGAAPAEVARYQPLLQGLDQMTRAEYRLIRRFVERRAELDPIAQAAVGQRLARPLLDRLRLNLPIAYQSQYADVLDAIERTYAEERGLL